MTSQGLLLYNDPSMARGRLSTLIFFVTSTCNSKCRTCFYWEDLNQSGDLTLDEIDRLTRTMPRFDEVWFSGGEPTLRAELPEITSFFYARNGVRSVNLPVNGLLPGKLVEQIESIHEVAPELRINVNLALDGFEETHDRIRGVPGNFKRAVESLEALERLRRSTRHLRVHVNSVICAENLDEMLPLGEHVRDRFDLDGHYFQVIRGAPLDPALLAVRREAISRIYAGVKPLYRHYASKIKDGESSFAASWKRAYYLGALSLYHDVQVKNLDRSHDWPMACSAGETILVLDANGDVRACELRETIGNVREVDCDWTALWGSAARKDEVAAIERDRCFCTHVCFIHASLKASPKALLWDVPRAYLASG